MKTILMIFLASLPGTMLAAEKWKIHTNPRFGIRIEHPADLNPQTTAPNGSLHSLTDGRLTLTVHGHFLNGITLDDHWKRALADHGKTITYKIRKDSWFVVSGVRADGTEYYRKFHTQNGNWAEFVVSYPHRLNKTYDPVVERLAKTFVPFLKGNYDRTP